MNTITANSINYDYLISLYEKLVISILDQKRSLIKSSAILTLLKINSNLAFKVFSNSTIKFPSSSISNLMQLEKLGYVKKINDIENEYLITFWGIWFIEDYKEIINIRKLLSEIQNDKVKLSLTDQILSDKEKLIIFSLISLRSFSSKCSMDLNIEGNSNNWYVIMNNVIIPEMKKWGLLSSKNLFATNTGNEHPVRFIMRRANNLSAKTNGLFVAHGNSQYYLSINTDDNENAIKQIKYLLKRTGLLINNAEKSEQMKIYLCNSANNASFHVQNNFDFINFDWDSIIKDSIDRLFLSID